MDGRRECHKFTIRQKKKRKLWYLCHMEEGNSERSLAPSSRHDCTHKKKEKGEMSINHPVKDGQAELTRVAGYVQK